MLRQFTKKHFDLPGHNTTLKKEVMAGIVSFFTIIYIVAVNSSILSEAGIPLEAAIIGTILTSVFGCVLMGLWSNSPIILVPGMGINAMFSYTMVQSMGLSWQAALGVTFVSGLLFVLIAFTSLSTILTKSIPHSLKEAITVGIGLFLAFIGLEKGGIVVGSQTTLVKLGDLSDPYVVATIITLLLAIALFMLNVPGNFLISMIAGTCIAFMFGLVDVTKMGDFSFSFGDYTSLFGAMSFSGITSYVFWMATFSLTMVLVFENIGLVHGHTQMANSPEKFKRSFQANSISAMMCGLFGSSPTVSTVETAAGITAGGRTGITAITTGLLFLCSIFFIPVIKIIPGSAIAPILIIIGGLMLQNIKNIDLHDLSEGFPAFFIIVMIPLTYSIADGIAVGFIMYPFLKILTGKSKEVSLSLYLIAGLFLVNFILHAMG
jgi:adenine/guanine/hypoxanthine permease